MFFIDNNLHVFLCQLFYFTYLYEYSGHFIIRISISNLNKFILSVISKYLWKNHSNLSIICYFNLNLLMNNNVPMKKTFVLNDKISVKTFLLVL